MDPNDTFCIIKNKQAKNVTSKNSELKKLELKKTSGWNSSEIKILTRLYPNHSNQKISEILKKSISSISSKAWSLELKKEVKYRQEINKHNNSQKKQAWCKDETQFLSSQYLFLSYEEIADVLGRTSTAISQKARSLNLRKYAR